MNSCTSRAGLYHIPMFCSPLVNKVVESRNRSPAFHRIMKIKNQSHTIIGQNIVIYLSAPIYLSEEKPIYLPWFRASAQHRICNWASHPADTNILGCGVPGSCCLKCKRHITSQKTVTLATSCVFLIRQSEKSSIPGFHLYARASGVCSIPFKLTPASCLMAINQTFLQTFFQFTILQKLISLVLNCVDYEL